MARIKRDLVINPIIRGFSNLFGGFFHLQKSRRRKLFQTHEKQLKLFYFEEEVRKDAFSFNKVQSINRKGEKIRSFIPEKYYIESLGPKVVKL